MAIFAASAVAGTVTGTVTDKTTGKPSTGDTVAVINTAKSMDEISKTTTDSTGNFHVDFPDGGQILLHVTHSGAEYFKSVPPGTASVDIDVYDSAAKIDGVSGEALVLRLETDPAGTTLNVAENFFVQNTSSPPKTQYGGNTFEFYLPKGAEIHQTLANSPNGLPTTTTVKTIDAATGHYSFTFPVRPGETRFQVAYSIPYKGKLPISLKLAVPTGDFAVMLPKSMQFTGSASFQPINDPSVANAQSYDEHQPPAGQPIQFTIAGTGQLPDSTAQSGSDEASGNAPAAQSSGTRPGGGLGAPEDPGGANDANPWAKYRWWILTVLGLILVGGAGFMLKANPATADAGLAPLPPVDITVPTAAYAAHTATVPAAAPTAGANPLLQALKDELLELETDRLAGKLTPAEYAEHKAAFDVVLRRALSRTESA